MARDMDTVEQLRVACQYAGLKLICCELGRDIAQTETRMQRWERIQLDYLAMRHIYVEQETLQQGRRRKAARGGWVGGPRLHRKYGYELIELQGRREYRAIPEEQGAIARIVDACPNGKGYTAMAKRLNVEGVPTVEDGRWTAKTVRDQALRGTVKPAAVPATRVVVNADALRFAS